MGEVSHASGALNAGRNTPQRLHEVYDEFVAKTPDHIALVEDGAAWTYGELDAHVRVTAGDLVELGVRPGDRVMIVSENCIALASLLLAASRLNAWAIVVNPRLSAREIDQIRDHSGTRRMFFTVAVSKEAAAHAERLAAETRRVGPFERLGVGPLNEATVPERVEDDPAKQVVVLIYTSGTTGTPKGVMLSHDNLLVSAKSTAELRELDAKDKLYVVLPISHIVGISILAMTLMTGGTVRLVSRYDPAALVKALAEERVTVLNGVPATYQRLLEYKTVAGIDRLDKGSLRLMAVAGAPLDVGLKARVEAEFGVALSNGYGITECSPGISGVRIYAPRSDNTVGILLPGVEARVRTLDGLPLGEGEVGELHVRGRNIMLGYYRSPDLTAKAIDSEGWFNTGDLARFEKGYLYIVGRTKEMIIRSGFNVYPAEIEAVLGTHAEVMQSAVVGRKVEGNEEVVAFVQLLKGSKTTVGDLARFLEPQLAAYKRPSEIIVLDTLPATSTGKILKHQLAQSFQAAPEAAGVH